MAVRKQPRRWVFFALDTVPPTLPVPTYRWADRPMVYQAFPAFIEGRVPVDGWLDIVRAASSASGEYSVDHGAVVLNDADALIRSLLAEYSTQWFVNRMVHFLLLSDHAIASGLLPPRILIAGRCTDVQLLDDRRAQMEVDDILGPYLDRLYPQYRLTNAHPNAPTPLLDQVLPIYYGPHVQTKVDPVTGLPTQGICPTFFIEFTGLSAGSGSVGEPTEQQAAAMAPYLNEFGFNAWGRLVVCAGDLQVPNIYGSNLAEAPSSILLTPARLDVDIYGPVTETTDTGFMETVIYARGPVLWAHITGTVQITCDVCGWPDADGDPIDQAAFAYQDFLTQHVLSHDGAGFTGGPLAGLTMFPPTVDIDRSMIWTSKIQALQAVTAARLGTDKGALISMGLTKATPLREILRTWHVTFDAFSAKNSAGQLYPFVIDDIADPDEGVPIRERIELLGLPAPRIGWTEIENEIDYTYGWDHVRQEPRTVTITIRDQAAIDALKGDVRKVDGIRNLAYTADDATATDTMGRRLMRLRQPPRYQPLPMRTDAVDREIGEQVRISHRDGFGPRGVGYDRRPMVLMQSVHHGNNVTMEALDVGALLVAVGRVGEDAMTDWDSATDEERAIYFFATADDGTVPSGGLRGMELR